MKKLKIDLNQLQVSSFVVEATGSHRGTINGFAAPTEDWDCSLSVCPQEPATMMDPCRTW